MQNLVLKFFLNGLLPNQFLYMLRTTILCYLMELYTLYSYSLMINELLVLLSFFLDLSESLFEEGTRLLGYIWFLRLSFGVVNGWWFNFELLMLLGWLRSTSWTRFSTYVSLGHSSCSIKLRTKHLWSWMALPNDQSSIHRWLSSSSHLLHFQLFKSVDINGKVIFFISLLLVLSKVTQLVVLLILAMIPCFINEIMNLGKFDLAPSATCLGYLGDWLWRALCVPWKWRLCLLLFGELIHCLHPWDFFTQVLPWWLCAWSISLHSCSYILRRFLWCGIHGALWSRLVIGRSRSRDIRWVWPVWWSWSTRCDSLSSSCLAIGTQSLSRLLLAFVERIVILRVVHGVTWNFFLFLYCFGKSQTFLAGGRVMLVLAWNLPCFSHKLSLEEPMLDYQSFL
jgi:hypothetical protein